MLKEEREKIPGFWLESERVRTSLESEASWMFSYLTAANVENPSLDSFQLRLALCHPSEDYELGLYPPNSGCFVCS